MPPLATSQYNLLHLKLATFLQSEPPHFFDQDCQINAIRAVELLRGQL